MSVSVVGLEVCLGILLLGWSLGSPLIVGMIASLAFGSTALMTLSAVGGSSPLIYVIFSLLFCARMAVVPRLVQGMSVVFKSNWVPWVVCGLAIYAAASAVLLPRLFAGSTSAFVAGRDYGVVEVALAPGSGNITQTSYFLLGALTFLGLSTLLIGKADGFVILRRGMLTWCVIIATGGVVDILGKMVGLQDVLAPIRTATFSYLTNVEEAGFQRISGTFSEASSFAASSLAAFAFCFSDWRRSGSKLSASLALVLISLLIISTSSTAYVCLSVMIVGFVLLLLRSALCGQLSRSDLLVLALASIAGTAVLALLVWDPHRLDAFGQLIQSTVFDKSSSQSAKERSYWNEESLKSLVDTWGVGIGFGSSRTSNWLVAVLSQLGIIGTILQLLLLIPLVWRKPRASTSGLIMKSESAMQVSLQACGATGVLSNILIGGSADPGLLFFIILAGLVVLRCRNRSQQEIGRGSIRTLSGPHAKNFGELGRERLSLPNQ